MCRKIRDQPTCQSRDIVFLRLLAVAIIQFIFHSLYGKLCNMFKFAGLGWQLVFDDTGLGIVVKFKRNRFTVRSFFFRNCSKKFLCELQKVARLVQQRTIASRPWHLDP
jgi:hypothetical protein